MKKKTDTELLAFFREILVTYVYQKHKVELSVEEFKLPKLEYKGNFVDFQRVRAKKNPKIEVVETKTAATQPGTKEQNTETSSASAFAGGPRDPDWKLMVVNTDNEVTEFDGFNLLEAKQILIVVELPILVTGKHVAIQVSEKMLVFTCAKIYDARIRLPLEVVPDKTHAVFVTAERVLNVTLTPKSRPLTSEEQAESQLFDGVSLREPSAAQVLLEENRRKIEKNYCQMCPTPIFFLGLDDEHFVVGTSLLEAVVVGLEDPDELAHLGAFLADEHQVVLGLAETPADFFDQFVRTAAGLRVAGRCAVDLPLEQRVLFVQHADRFGAAVVLGDEGLDLRVFGQKRARFY